MKISRDNYDKVCGRIQAEATEPVSAEKKIGREAGIQSNGSQAPTLPKDIVQISSKAKEYYMGKNFVRTAISKAEADVGYERLLRLKNEVAAGTYHVPSDKIASAILGNIGFNI